MRAVVCRAFGGFDRVRIEETPPPDMIADGVRIAVAVSGVNFFDSLVIGGTYQRKPPLPFSPGMAAVGIVVETAPGVTRVKPGDRVFATIDHGAYAEQAVAPADQVHRIPDDLDLVTAAAFPFGYSTSYGSLVWCARLKPDETLLVHGSAGSVGLAAVEIGKAIGATVIATAGSAEKCAAATAHGADHAIDYSQGGFRERVLELTGGRGADVVYDPLGGDAAEQSLRCVAPEGRMLVIGFAAGRVHRIPANILLVKNVTVIGFWWAYYRKNHPDWADAAFARLFAWRREGKIDPAISHRFALEQYEEAIGTVTARKSIGSVVLLTGAAIPGE